jgi:hypothetical protein
MSVLDRKYLVQVGKNNKNHSNSQFIAIKVPRSGVEYEITIGIDPLYTVFHGQRYPSVNVELQLLVTCRNRYNINFSCRKVLC